MDKKEYIRNKLAENSRLWLRRACLWGCLLFLFLAWLDYLILPEYFQIFLQYRVVVSLLLIGGYFLARRIPQEYLSFVTFVLVIGAAIAIELMVLRFGGHESPYYVGMILLGISVVGFIPARFLLHLIITLAI
jgi:hypothetical protein